MVSLQGFTWCTERGCGSNIVVEKQQRSGAANVANKRKGTSNVANKQCI
jgi:hypothetical protein